MTFGKIGPHCQTHSDAAKLWASVAPIVLQMDATDYLSAVGAGVPTVFRKYFPSPDPVAAGMSASTIYQQIMSELGGFRPSYVQLFNENNQSQGTGLAAWADIVAQIVPMFHGAGIKVAGFCFSTGNPFQADVEYLVGRGWCGSDAIIQHEYWGCVSSDSRVLTADLRWVAAGELTQGDELLGFDEEPVLRTGMKRIRQMRRSVVLHNELRMAECAAVVLDNGQRLICTVDHPWLVQAQSRRTGTKYNWLTLQHIERALKDKRRRSSLSLPRFFEPWTERDSYAAGFLAGAFDAEGSLTFHGGNPIVAFAQKPNPFAEQVQRYLADEGYNTKGLAVGKNGIAQLYLNGGKSGILSCLGGLRPPRLLDVWRNRIRSLDGFGRLNPAAQPGIVAVEYVGKREISALGTSTHTYFAEGFGAHNTEGFTSDNALRHRLLDQWAGGPSKHPPIIIGECGRANIEPVGGAGSGDVGWQDWGIDASEYANELHQYDALISQDAYVLGATVFTAAPSTQWTSFSTDGILDAMGITAPGTGGTGGSGGGTGGTGGTGGAGGTATATPWWGSLPWYFWAAAAAAIGVAAIGVSSAMAEGEARASEPPQIAYEHDADKPIPAGYHRVG